MSINLLRAAGLAAAGFALPTLASAATVTAGAGGFDNGFATQITYDDAADRGTNNDRDNAVNALGATDSSFFEIGFGSTVDFTFGTLFNTEASIFEVTFGQPANAPESADVYAGINGVFVQVGSVTNADAFDGATVTFHQVGVFDTLRLIDTSPLSSSFQTASNGTLLGGFDVNSVQVSAVPVPAAGLLLLSAVGGMAAMRRRKSKA
ncbi:MAG: VPLPA-CTERM sorting domain-containing protein [Litoreibacter sp.]